MTNYKNFKIYEIAQVIRKDWVKMSPYAKHYVDAMHCIKNIDEMHVADRASSVVNYFLANAQSWRGDIAREVKKELNSRITMYNKNFKV